ncbi:unnamed protein product [Prunus armeniaca]|uniref:Reverse transcriptase domain-containing protein n=1 Tax=Prunus armeniaca TaxID=36596 RepID=A0A6J5Y0D5_PRUAR|nr:unnamed protein product [Prunus armeniaca]
MSTLAGRAPGFYGHPDQTQRHHSWELLRRLGRVDLGPWLCCGDFNEFEFTGYPFTWSNKLKDTAHVEARLDRGFGNLALLQHWGNFTSHHLVAFSSDHHPILIASDGPHGDKARGPRGRRRFQFEEVWTKEVDCEEVVRHSWQNAVSPLSNIDNCASNLSRWSAEKGGQVPKKVKELRLRLASLQSDEPSTQTFHTRSLIETELDKCLEQEEIYWHQRSRVHWLQHGDRNTSFFHKQATSRRKKNALVGILDENDRWQREYDKIGGVFVEFFTNLFTLDMGVADVEVFSAVQARVSSRSYHNLLLPYSRDEIEVALNSIGPTKAPGPDGMPALFYQKYWSIVGPEIPKVHSPTRVSEYRPISLCNVLYKIISKTLANRLKKVLPEVISEFQSAFIPNRMILDNVLAAFETVHCLKRRGKTGKKKLILKLDMAKAYGRVEWQFLEQMLRTMGFPIRFIQLIMGCVTTVSYSLLIQGRPFGRIIPSRGLRQGDPISPYLFLIVAEAFSALLQQAERDSRLHGVSIAPSAPSINHLFFADDSLLFCNAGTTEALELKRIFGVYELASGQKVNLGKSALCFSPSTPRVLQDDIRQLLNVTLVPCHERYLGLPTIVGKDKKKLFRTVKDRVWNKVNGWQGKLLSKAGKEVLIKSVCQAIPSYSMSVFRLPVGLCREIESIIAKFWWSKNDGRGIHWKKWSFMCQHKSDGGLGFRELTSFNQALLCKQGWRLLEFPHSLIARMLKARYFPNSDFLAASSGSLPSFTWQSLLWGRDLLRLGLRWRIATSRVCDLFTASGGWDVGKVFATFSFPEAEAILSIPLMGDTLDRRIWNFTKNGRYSVKSGYWAALEYKRLEELSARTVAGPSSSSLKSWKHLWKLKVPQKSFICYGVWLKISSLPRRSYSGVGLHKGRDFLLPTVADVGTWMDAAWSVIPPDKQSLFAFTVWVLWNERNGVLFGSQPTPSRVLVQRAKDYDAEFKRYSAANHRSLSSPVRDIKWRPPTGNCFKLNVDGATDMETGARGAGAIVRDSHGNLVGALAMRAPSRISVLATELYALKVGISFALDVSPLPLEIESDSVQAVSMVNSEEECLTTEGGLVDGVRHLLVRSASTVVRHVPRQANKAAHRIARFSLRDQSLSFWLDVGPLWLMDAVYDDWHEPTVV